MLDDLMHDAGKDHTVADIFTKLTHHMNITCLLLLQDVFPKGKHNVTISRNAQYVFLFRNKRDKVGIRAFLCQVYPVKWMQALAIFNKCTKKPHTYLMLDLHSQSENHRTLYCNVLTSERPTICYEENL